MPKTTTEELAEIQRRWVDRVDAAAEHSCVSRGAPPLAGALRLDGGGIACPICGDALVEPEQASLAFEAANARWVADGRVPHGARPVRVWVEWVEPEPDLVPCGICGAIEPDADFLRLVEILRAAARDGLSQPEAARLLKEFESEFLTARHLEIDRR